MSTIDQRIETIEKMMTEILAILKNEQPATDNAKPTKTKTTKAKAVKDDQDKPKTKRGPTGYLVFSNATRQDVKTSLAEAEESTNPKDVTRELARRWKALTDEEREDWNAKAKAAKDAASDIE